jgi:hypothetical protein
VPWAADQKNVRQGIAVDIANGYAATSHASDIEALERVRVGNRNDKVHTGPATIQPREKNSLALPG